MTILWIGFVLSISFMEAPLRFQAASITVPIALEVGRLVFHSLNICEIVFAVWIFCCQLRRPEKTGSKRLFWFVLFLLTVQTILLFAVLDSRTNAIIAGQEVAASNHHTIYIGLEFAKLIGLVLLAFNQIQDFKRNLSHH